MLQNTKAEVTLSDTNVRWVTYLDGIGIHGLLSVEKVSEARHEVVRVRLNAGREFFAKRGAKRLPNGDGGLLAEGLAYKLLSEIGLSRLFPRCVAHDRKSDTILLEAVSGASMRQSVDCSESIPPNIWSKLGQTIAHLHFGTSNYPSWVNRVFGGFDDLIPNPSPLTPAEFARASAAELSVLAIIQSDPLVAGRLSKLRARTPRCVVHGDLRLDNVLYDSTTKSMRLVDIELARPGCPEFDLGTFAGSIVEYVAYREYPKRGNLSASGYLSQVFLLSREAIRAFIAGYLAQCREAKYSVGIPAEFKIDFAFFLGVHLIQRAGASASIHGGETEAARFFAIAGCSVLRDPELFLRTVGLDSTPSHWNQTRSRS